MTSHLHERNCEGIGLLILLATVWGYHACTDLRPGTNGERPCFKGTEPLTEISHFTVVWSQTHGPPDPYPAVFHQHHSGKELTILSSLQIQPYPSDESLQKKLQNKTNWEAFKTMIVNDQVSYNKYVATTLA